MSERRYQGRPADSFGFEAILYAKDGPVATVTFNRPRVLNAVNFTVLNELAVAFQDAAWDDAIAVVVLTGLDDQPRGVRRRPAVGGVERGLGQAQADIGGMALRLGRR